DAPIDFADIDARRLPVGDGGDGRFRLEWNAEIFGEVIERAEWHDAERDFGPDEHIGNGVESPIAADRDDDRASRSDGTLGVRSQVRAVGLDNGGIDLGVGEEGANARDLLRAAAGSRGAVDDAGDRAVSISHPRRNAEDANPVPVSLFACVTKELR